MVPHLLDQKYLEILDREDNERTIICRGEVMEEEKETTIDPRTAWANKQLERSLVNVTGS